MKEYYPLKIVGLERKLPVCKISDTLCIAAFVIFGDVELTVAAAGALCKKAPEHDIIVTPEAKSIPLAHEIARQEGNKPYVVARKSAKLYMKDVFTVEVQSITTKNKQTLCIDTAEADMLRGKRVLIVDDVISTGGSLHAAEELVERAGGNVVGRMAILAEGDAAKRDDIIFLEYLPLLNSEGNPL